MMNDFFIILNWWLLLAGLGLAAFPLTWFFFRNFFDLGYPFGKILAVLLVGYLVWLLGSLHLLPFQTLTIWLTILTLLLANILVLKKFRKEIIDAVKSGWKILFFEEILFFASLASWSFVRGFQPDIEGLEKFMDFGFVNSILRSDYFPPADMWMAGKTLNYYYFGHFIAAVLTKLSTLPSSITYNLMISTIFALAFTATFSLSGNLVFSINNQQSTINKKMIFGGLVSAVLLTLGGNLQILWYFLTHNFSFTGYWYPDATRFIVEKFGAADNTIHEFPLYSFVVSDLHGHVSDIPFVLLFLALLFSFIVAYSRLSPHTSPISLLTTHFPLLSLTLAVMYMTNSWDFPIYFLVLGVAVLWLNYQKYKLTFQTITQTALFTFCLLIFTFLFSLPFHLNFSQIAQGIGFVHARTPFWQLLVLWGYQWIIGLSFLIFLFIRKRFASPPADAWSVSDRRAGHFSLHLPDVFILILVSVATLLIVLPEFIYVKDIYIASYHRANTMFKLTYQSFMLYALASGYILVRLWFQTERKALKVPIFTFYILLFTFVVIYPYFAISSYYGELKTYRGLEGLNFLANKAPDDFAGISWLKQNVNRLPRRPAGQQVVLEAAGDSYTDFGRVSMATGLPTVQGWLVHEWLWRGSYDEPGKRVVDVELIYQSNDLSQTKTLLDKYQVSYVFVGTKEREKYQVSEDKFMSLGSLVFSKGNTKIYSLLK